MHARDSSKKIYIQSIDQIINIVLTKTDLNLYYVICPGKPFKFYISISNNSCYYNVTEFLDSARSDDAMNTY